MEKHGKKYDYSNVEYKGAHKKICIICPMHGEFLQSPNSHLNGHGCPKCKTEKLKLRNKVRTYTTQMFIEKSIKIHNNKYDYSETIYTYSNTKVTIICPKHGKFLQSPNTHLSGYGCPYCKKSSIENIIKTMLEENNIKYFHSFRGFDWLKYKIRLELDFYLPDHNIAIECQGEQHFKPISYFGGQKTFDSIYKRDIIKQDLCKQHNLPLYYINYNDNIEEKLNEILEQIRIPV